MVKELKELGFPDQELEAAGFTRRAVKAVDGRSVWLLKEDGGYKVAELREYGFVVGELRGIYTVKDLKGEGFSLQELREGGVPEHAVQAVDGRSTRCAPPWLLTPHLAGWAAFVGLYRCSVDVAAAAPRLPLSSCASAEANSALLGRELRRAGYPARVMRKVGFSLSELVKGAYTATELKEANYGAAELKEVSFTAGALRVASFTSKQLRTAGYTLKQMQEGGFFWKDLGTSRESRTPNLVDASCRLAECVLLPRFLC